MEVEYRFLWSRPLGRHQCRFIGLPWSRRPLGRHERRQVIVWVVVSVSVPL